LKDIRLGGKCVKVDTDANSRNWCDYV